MASVPVVGPFVAVQSTANATPVNVVVCTVPSGSVVVLETTIVAKTGSLNGAGYTLVGTFKNASGTAAQVGTPVAALVNEDAALSAAAVVYNVTGATVRVNLTGISATVDWTINTYITQV